MDARKDENPNGEQNNRICDISTRGLQTDFVLRRYNAEHTEVICFFIHCYYSQIIRSLVRTFTVY